MSNPLLTITLSDKEMTVNVTFTAKQGSSLRDIKEQLEELIDFFDAPKPQPQAEEGYW